MKVSVLNVTVLSAAFSLMALSDPASARSGSQPNYKRADKSFDNAQTNILEAGSQFKRRPGFRELEAQKKEEEAAAVKKAADDAKKAQQAQVAAEQKRKQTAISSNNQGVQLGKAGRWVEAIQAHEMAVRCEPENKQLRINLSAACVVYGQHRLAAGDLNAAASAFRKALTAAPDNGLAAKLLSNTIKHSGRDPESADVRLEIADQLAAAGDLQSAVFEYQAALQLENSGRTYTKMGDLALRCGQLPTAQNWYQQAIVKDPDCAAAHRQLGLLALSQKDATGAAASLRKALILDSSDTAAGQALVDLWRRQVAANPLVAENHLGLAGAYQLTNDFASADQEYRKLETLEPQHPGLAPGRASLDRAKAHVVAEKHRLAAETLYSQGLGREALVEIMFAVKAEPKNARYQLMLGQILEAIGDYKNAHQAYLTCVLIDPVNNKLAAAHIKQMQQRMKTNGTSSSELSDLANQLAHQITGNTATTTNQPTRINREHSNQEMSAEAQAVLFQVNSLESKKDFVGAANLLRTTVAGNMQNAELHHRLALNLKATGQLGEALSEFRIASALAPTNTQFAADLTAAQAANKTSLLSQESTAGGAK